MMQFEYCGIGNGTASIKDYPDGILAEICQRTEIYENMNAWPWGSVDNCSPLMDEIADNLMNMQPDCREMYAEELICKMQTWTWLYSLSKEKLDAVSNSVVEYSIEMYFHKWRNAFRTFAEKLAVILAKLGINILDIQKRCGITLIERLDINDLWMDFGTPQLAEYHMSRLNESIGNNQHLVNVGRRKSCASPFITLMAGDNQVIENTLQILHQIIDGNKGKMVGCAILACFKAGMLYKIPSYKQVKQEFAPNGEDIGNAKGYSRWTCIEEYNEDKPRNKDIFDQMLQRFKSNRL